MMDSAQELSKSSKEHNQQLLCNNPSASLSDVKHEDEEPINWKIPSRQVEMEKDDKYHELGNIDEQQQQMMADSPIPKYNKKESGVVVPVDEKISDNQEVNSCFSLYVLMFIIKKISILFHVKAAVCKCDFFVWKQNGC